MKETAKGLPFVTSGEYRRLQFRTVDRRDAQSPLCSSGSSAVLVLRVAPAYRRFISDGTLPWPSQRAENPCRQTDITIRRRVGKALRRIAAIDNY
jgi:hypothetical protein